MESVSTPLTDARMFDGHSCSWEGGPGQMVVDIKFVRQLEHHLTELVSLLLQTRDPIGPMHDRKDYPSELQRAIDFLHGREEHKPPQITSIAEKMVPYRLSPLCEEHGFAGGGGTRSNCPYCAMQKLYAALSKIDYICGEPNEMEVSGFDVYYNEDAVVEHVKSRLTSKENQFSTRDLAREILRQFKRDIPNTVVGAMTIVLERFVETGKYVDDIGILLGGQPIPPLGIQRFDEHLRKATSVARNDAIEEAAVMCEQLAQAWKDYEGPSVLPIGCAEAIRSMKTES